MNISSGVFLSRVFCHSGLCICVRELIFFLHMPRNPMRETKNRIINISVLIYCI